MIIEKKYGCCSQQRNMHRKEFTMEIERKYLIKKLPENLTSFEHHLIEQGISLHRARRENPPAG